MTLNALDVLRLQVQVPTEGLPNLTPNPDGELGAWGWSTPVANTTMSNNQATGGPGGGPPLEFATSVSQAAYFATNQVAATVGNWYAGRFHLSSVAAGHGVRTRLEFFDSVRNALASGPQSAYQSGADSTFYVPAAQAPASTAYVRLRFDFYQGSANANPAAASWIDFDSVMLTTDPSNIFGSIAVLKNLELNPSFETGTVQWFAGSGTSMSKSTAAGTFKYGTASLLLRRSSGSGDVSATNNSATIPVTPGKSYWVTAWTLCASQTRQFVLNVKTTGNVFSGITEASPVGIYTRHWYKYTPPAGVTTIGMSIGFLGVANGENNYVDAVSVTEVVDPAAPEEYFDGSTPPSSDSTHAYSYAWDGTVGGSFSTRTIYTFTPFDYAEAATWLNILGPTHEISIEREELNLGTLTATIFDTDLDPSKASTIRPGVAIRLQTAYTFGGLQWTPLFNGQILTGDVTYDLLNPDRAKRAKITLTAVDNLTKLANTTVTSVVGSIDDLAGILEGANVPWEINGSSSQIPTVTQVATIDSAAVVDQVAIARDIESGYAYVDRFGVLHVESPAYRADMDPPPTSAVTFDEAYYSDLVAGYNTEDCINEVNVTWLRGVTDTEEIAYGPYRDADSIAQWGAHATTLKLAGATENATAIAAVANRVLTANAVPQLHIREITCPIREAGDTLVATLELCSLARVTNTDNGLDQTQRVNSIKQAISASNAGTKWLVTYGFRPDGSVANPQLTPSP